MKPKKKKKIFANQNTKTKYQKNLSKRIPFDSVKSITFAPLQWTILYSSV